MQALTHRFTRVDGRRRSDWERLQRDFARRQEEEARKDKLEQDNHTEFFALAVELAAASATRIASFRIRLDTYDTATVAALMKNQERLDAVNEQINALLGRAYQLEDGRRVFRTEDGMQVFDQDGQEVSADIVHPDEIGPEYPVWEEYVPIIEERDELVREREELLEYQERLDEAREQVEDGHVTDIELDDLEAELAVLMPDSVRTHVLGIDVEEPGTELETSSVAKPNAFFAIATLDTPSL